MQETVDYSFENYITGKPNKFAFEAAKAVSDNPGKTYNPLLIYGDSGLGKTHLLNAIKERISKQLPDAVIDLVSADDLILQMLSAIKAEQPELWYKDLLSADILLIDDMHVLTGKKATQLEFAAMIRALVNKGHQVVMTSSVPPEALPWLDSCMRTEFAQGLFADIQPIDTETAKAIAQDKAAKCGLQLSNEIIESLSSQFGGEVRRVEGIVTHLRAESDLMGTHADLAAVEGDTEC